MSGSFANAKQLKEVDPMKTKLDEISENLNKYENMIHNLGKDYINSVSNKKESKKNGGKVNNI